MMVNQNGTSNGGRTPSKGLGPASSFTSNSSNEPITAASGSSQTNSKPAATRQQRPKDQEEIITTMSTSSLEAKLRQLRQESQEHSQILTQKLASSQSGQNLLHIGTSLSTLPPDLHNLLTQLHPLLSTVETVEKHHMEALQALVQQATAVRAAGRRVQIASDAADLYADFCAAEKSVRRETKQRCMNVGNEDDNESESGEVDNGEDSGQEGDLHHAASLERAAHVTLCLVEDLHAASQHVSLITATPNKKRESMDESTALPSLRTPLEQDTEKAQFLMKLAPRIRRLESDTIRGLTQRMETILVEVQERHRRQQQDDQQENASQNSGGSLSGGAIDITTSNSTDSGLQSLASSASGGDLSYMLEKDNNMDEKRSCSDSDLLLMLGHCMRGLALLGRGKEVESIFARVAIMPLIRSKLSMGRLDEGGARGECAGLASLLQDIVSTIQETFGRVLCLAEAMFHVDGAMVRSGSSRIAMDVDLLTAGVWVPIATALMADAGIKMAIFSPGIASILQANYVTLDVFLLELAERLLIEDTSVSVVTTEEDEQDYHLLYRPSISIESVQQAQDRVYTHAKTAEFSKRWNLPIYYQLRFGDCCTRLNKAVDQTKREGWIAQVFSGPEQQAEFIKQQIGFELSLFLELYDILLTLWRPDVVLRPLANRFLRGAVQMVGRVVAFVSDSMEGKIKFGEEPRPPPAPEAVTENGGAAIAAPPSPVTPYRSSRSSYCWGESEEDVAAVAWELTILESAIQHDYVDTVCRALAGASSSRKTSGCDNDPIPPSDNELRQLVTDVLQDLAEKIHPIIDKAWNEVIVQILTAKCSTPLAAVKGVAATYRMTNRPPPTQASPFVATVLRPLKEFSQEYLHRTPDRVGSKWKHQIVVTISDRYASAVQELLTTVQRTEEALKSRKTTQRARMGGVGGAAGLFTDGEKVKLQVYLDFLTFRQSVRDVGVEPSTVIGLGKLQELTAEGESLQQRLQQKNGK